MRNAAAIVGAKRILLECESGWSCLLGWFAALGEMMEHASTGQFNFGSRVTFWMIDPNTVYRAHRRKIRTYYPHFSDCLVLAALVGLMVGRSDHISIFSHL